jgi:hypothetical protein
MTDFGDKVQDKETKEIAHVYAQAPDGKWIVRAERGGLHYWCEEHQRIFHHMDKCPDCEEE